MAGLYPGWSPYAYVLGDPVALTDPTGMYAEGGDGGGDEDLRRRARYGRSRHGELQFRKWAVRSGDVQEVRGETYQYFESGTRGVWAHVPSISITAPHPRAGCRSGRGCGPSTTRTRNG